MDFLLDLVTWDVPIEGGKLAEVMDPLAEMRQRVGIAIKLLLGEWPYDAKRGLPWIEEILVKEPNLNQIQSRFRAYILSIEGILSIRSLVISLDDSTGMLTIVLDLETVVGLTGPFQIKVTP